MAKTIEFNNYIRQQTGSPYHMRIYRYYSGTTWSTNLTNLAANNIFYGGAGTPNAFQAGDAIYFGMKVQGGGTEYGNWRGIQVNVGTALDDNGGAADLVWEYWDGSAWTTIPSMTDGTNKFNNTGSNTVDFPPPSDWISAYLPTIASGAGGTIPTEYAYWARARINSVTSPVHRGLLAAATYYEFGNNAIQCITTAGDVIDFDDIYQADVTGGWGVITPLDSTKTTGHRAYEIDCKISPGKTDTPIGSSTTQTGDVADKNIDLIFTNNHYLWQYNNSGSSLTLGDEYVSGTTSGQPVNIHYNYSNGIARMEAWIDCEVHWYGVNVTGLRDNVMVQTSNFLQTHRVGNPAVTCDYINCQFQGIAGIHLKGDGSSVTRDVKMMQGLTGIELTANTGVLDNIGSIGCGYGMQVVAPSSASNIENLTVSGNTSRLIVTYIMDETIRLRNSDTPDPTPGGTGTDYIRWQAANVGEFYKQFSFDIHVVDVDGANVASATVAVTPTGSSEKENNFSVSTAADGTITTQWVTQETWAANPTTGTTNLTTVTNYDTFTLTISKAGYADTVFTDITLDEKIDWTVQLLAPSTGGGTPSLSRYVR